MYLPLGDQETFVTSDQCPPYVKRSFSALAPHFILMTAKGERGPASADVPDVYRASRTGFSQMSAIGGPGQSRHFIFAAQIAKGRQQDVRGRVPDLPDAVIEPLGQILAIGRLDQR